MAHDARHAPNRVEAAPVLALAHVGLQLKVASLPVRVRLEVASLPKGGTEVEGVGGQGSRVGVKAKRWAPRLEAGGERHVAAAGVAAAGNSGGGG
eukprot:1819036-Prymnesium_polylepis.1